MADPASNTGIDSVGNEFSQLCVSGEGLRFRPSPTPTSILQSSSSSPSTNPAPSQAEQVLILDSSLWSNLPDSIIEKIMAHLPIVDLFRFRAVCTRWNGLLENAAFLRSCAGGPISGPWFLIFTRGDYRNGITHDHTSNKWHRIPLFSHLPPYESLYPCAAAGGLVCFISRFNALGTMTLVVCNPLTNSWRELPPMVEILPLYAVGILFETDDDRDRDGNGDHSGVADRDCDLDRDRNRSRYHVVVSGLRRVPPPPTASGRPAGTVSCRLRPTTEMFTSTEAEWRTTGGMPPGSYHSLAVPCRGILYSWCYVSDALVAYDVRSGCWTQIYARMPRYFEGHRLVECEGQLFMLGGLNKDNVTKGIYVLEFRWESLEWVKVDRMPKLLCEQFLRYGTDFRCVGYSNLVLLYVVRYRRIRLAVLYDLGKKLWRRLPPCSLSEDRLIHGIAFEPRLDARA